MNNIIDELESELNLDIISYDYDEDEEVKNYNVGAKLPVLIVLDKEGNEVTRIIGEKTKKELKTILEGLL
jgi:thiol-disulfide isomerase/thioredoxin